MDGRLIVMIISSKNTQIELYQSLLLSMFSSIQILRDDGNLVDVPAYLTTKDQLHKHVLEIEYKECVDSGVKKGLNLPAIIISFEDLTFDSERSLNKLNRKTHMMFANRRAIATYEDIPVDLMFSVSVATKTAEDMYAIIEAIQGAFKNNYIKKHVPISLYHDELVVTPVQLSSITPMDELGLGNEEGGREVQVVLTITVKGIIHSYISGQWKEVLNYYRQFDLIDSDGDGVLDAYKRYDKDGVEHIVLLGSDDDKIWMKSTLEELAKEKGLDINDILTKPKVEFNKIGDAVIEKILLRMSI